MNADFITSLGLIITSITVITSLISLFKEIRADKIIESISRKRFERSIFLAIPLLVDLSFVFIWVFLQVGINFLVIDKLNIIGIAQWILLSFQILFAVSTFIPMAMYIYIDIRSMILRWSRSKDKKPSSTDVYSGKI